MELPDNIYDNVKNLSDSGSLLFKSSAYMSAIQKWEAAKKLLPEPSVDWEAYLWLAASIGDAYYQLGDIELAKDNFYDALNNIEGQSNPFVNYRLGQCLYKQKNEEKSIDRFLKAYMLAGEEIFTGKEGKIYLKILKDKNLIS